MSNSNKERKECLNLVDDKKFYLYAHKNAPQG